MLEIIVPGRELYDEETESFINIKDFKLTLEHSLISLSKWESKWEKPFLSSEKTQEELIDYIRCMTLTPNVDPIIYSMLSGDNIQAVVDYTQAKMTATTIKNSQARRRNEVITAEIIYYWMVALNIPFECQKWHLNRLLTLIEVCSIKNQPQKNMSKSEILRSNRELNAARRAKFRTRG
jgi:hypothetical protein